MIHEADEKTRHINNKTADCDSVTNDKLTRKKNKKNTHGMRYSYRTLVTLYMKDKEKLHPSKLSDARARESLSWARVSVYRRRGVRTSIDLLRRKERASAHRGEDSTQKK